MPHSCDLVLNYVKLYAVIKCFPHVLMFVCSCPSGLDESVLEECLQYLEKQLENSQVRKAMEEFFSFRYLPSTHHTSHSTFHRTVQ